MKARGSRSLASAALVLLAALALAACAARPAPPEWKMNAHDAAERATRAWLSGDGRVAGQEWKRARAEVARTGDPALLARLELMRCAALLASLDMEGSACPAFEALRVDAEPAERAYAAYLAGRLPDAGGVELLPAAQRAAATDPRAIAAIGDPLARLVAAGAALQAGTATPGTLELATETASREGWRRPLLAWLLLRIERAEAVGDGATAEALRRRVAVVEAGGAPPAGADTPGR